MIIYISLGIAFIVPLLFLYFIRRFDLFGTGKFYFNIATLLWGVIAYFLAAKINVAMINAGWASRDQVIRLTAPVVEEFLKALILIYLVYRADFNYIVDGAIYGFGAGIGFAIMENYEYVMGHSAIALAVAVARVFSTNLIHATACGVIGTVLAYRRGNPAWQSWIFVVLGYAFSISFHIGFNTMVSSGALLIFAIVFGFMGLGLIYLAIRRGMNVQKAWLSEKLGDLNRVTQNEVKALNRIEQLDELLKPIAVQFGNDKTENVKAMLRMQAEIGIKLKLLDATPNEAKKNELTGIVNGLRRDMELLRKEVGAYCMMFVRTVYMDADLKIWDTIAARIAEANTGQKGGGMFDRLDSRVKSSKPAQEEPHG
jgi:RsiW-degrading membrane proteinase PrsW (M82 family)